ncbi:MAG TPA: ATP-binding protein [Thermoanaerobaculia bacterium]|nr:ATP-binding protein [Thermoanaerobaculia bacterium]
MARREDGTLAELTDAFLHGQAPADLEEALSILSLLGGAGRGGNTGSSSATAGAPAWPARTGEGRNLEFVEARYRALVEQIPAVVFLASVEGGLNDIYVSPQIESLLGFTQREWTSNPVLWFRQLHPDDRMRLSHEFAKTCVTGQPFRSIVRVFSRDGALVSVHAEARLVRDESGRPLFLHGVGFDITEQQKAEQTRQQLLLEQQARSAAEEASRRASFLARLSHALSANLDYPSIPGEMARLVVPELADLTALTVSSNGSLQTLALVHKDPAQYELAKRLWDRYPEPWHVSGEISRGRWNGVPVLVSEVDDAVLGAIARDAEHLALLRQLAPKSFMIVPVRGRNLVHCILTLVTAGSGRRYELQDLAVAEDVAQRAALAMDNAQLYQEAQEASRLKDEFLATLSHELRTPLNAIVGWTHILQATAADSSPNVRKAIETIARNAQVQNQLISDILDVSRIIAGKLALKVQPVDLVSVIEASLDTVRPAAQAKELLLQTILDASAGPVSGDPDRLQQVVWNLVSNAIKFTPRKGKVQIRLEAIDSVVEIVVEDSGPGIDPEFLPFVFERFRQADSSSTRRHGGLGLGLAIVRHLIELHGGSVQAANREDRSGAVFRVTLPRRSVASGATRAFAHPAAEDTGWLQPTPSLAGLRVLVVDDQRDGRELVATVLDRCGAQVTAAASAREAYEALQRARFDVLLADIEMPEEDGYSLIRRIRSLSPRQGGTIAAAALTAYASAQDRVRSLEAGFQMHLSKPVQPAELAAAVASLARIRKPRLGQPPRGTGEPR